MSPFHIPHALEIHLTISILFQAFGPHRLHLAASASRCYWARLLSIPPGLTFKMAPPKKRAKAKAAPAVSTPNGLGAVSNLPIAPSAHLMKVHSRLQILKDHALFSDISQEKPLTIQQGGSQAVFDATSCQKVLATEGAKFKAGSNFFWHDLTWMVNHRVPIRDEQIQSIQRFHYPPMDPPVSNPFDVTIALDDANFDVQSHLGALQAVCPEECRHALLFSLTDAIVQGAPEDILRRWRTPVLSTTFVFEAVAPGEARYWTAQNLREAMVEKGLSVKLSLRQRIIDVCGFKHDYETKYGTTISSSGLAKLYQKKMKYARSTEHVSVAWIDSAVTLNTRVFSVKEAEEILIWADSYFIKESDNPLGLIYAFQAIVDRGQTGPKIVNALKCLYDGYRMGFIELGEFACAKLKDYRRSYVEIASMKQSTKIWLLEEWMPGLQVKAIYKEKAHTMFQDFASVRAHLAPYPDKNGDTDAVDTTWQASWDQSGVQMFDIIEQLCFSGAYDNRYRDAVKSRLTVQDMMAYPSIQTVLEGLTTTIQSERSPTEVQSGPAGSTASATAIGPASSGATATGSAIGDSTLPSTSPGKTDASDSGFDTMSLDDQDHWKKIMTKMINTTVHFIPDNGSAAQLETDIRACPLALLKGDMTGFVIYHFDVKKYGIPTTRPELRITPLRDPPYHRLVRTTLAARAPPQEDASVEEKPSPALQAGELALLIDGGRKGNANRLLAPWREGTNKEGKKGGGNDDDDEEELDEEDDAADKKPGFVPSMLNLALTETSLAARRTRVRGTLSIKQLETAHIVSNARVCLPERPRINYDGTNRGNLISNIELPDLAKEWHMKWKDVKALYGKKHLILVGGKTDGIDTTDQPARPQDDSIVPVTYHSFPEALYEEFMHDFFCKLVIDLSPCDAKFAWAALTHRVGYVGISFNEDHSRFMHDRLMERLKVMMADPQCKLFNAQYAKDIGKQIDKEPDPKKGAKAVTKRKPKAKKATTKPGKDGGTTCKKKRKAASNTDDDKDDEDDDLEMEFSEVDDDEDEMWDPLDK